MTAAQRATLEKLMIDVDNWTDEESARQVDALRAALGTCGNCDHADTENAPDGFVYCTARMDDAHPFAARPMPLGERCTGWALRKDDDA
jgi:hypothetical protein